MIATTGAELLPPQALHILHTRLLPLATIATPNVPEALLLLKDTDKDTDTSSSSGSGSAPLAAVKNVDDLETIARAICKMGPKWVLVKGGHCPFNKDGTVAGTKGERERVVDVLVGEDGET